MVSNAERSGTSCPKVLKKVDTLSRKLRKKSADKRQLNETKKDNLAQCSIEHQYISFLDLQH